MSIQMEIIVRCESCGRDLETEVSHDKRYPFIPKFIVKPCERCIETAKEEARKED